MQFKKLVADVWLARIWIDSSKKEIKQNQECTVPPGT